MKHFKTHLYILAFITLFFKIGNSQEQYNDIFFQNISINDGLSHSLVNDIYQDDIGFMWFATGNGLCKYDGYKFTVYKNNINDTLSIGEDIINQIIPDIENKALWIIGNKSLIHFNMKNEVFTTCIKLDDRVMQSVFMDKRKLLWIGTSQGVFTFDPITKKSTPIDFIKNNTTCIYEDKEEGMWLGTGYGVYYYDVESKNTLKYQLNRNDFYSNSFQIIEDEKDDKWIANSTGLHKIDKSNSKISKFPYNKLDEFDISNSQVRCLFQDNYNNIWVGTTQNGIFIFDKQQEKYIYNYKVSSANTNSLSNNSINRIYKDKCDNIWIATLNGGLDKVNLSKKAFKAFKITSRKDEVIMSLLEDSKGNIWIGTSNNGLYMLNTKTGYSKQYKHNIYNSNSIGGGQIGAIAEDDEHNIWIITWAGTLNRINTTTNKIDVFKGAGNSLHGWAFRTMVINEYGIWLGSIDEGIELFNPKNGKSKVIAMPNSIKSVTCLYQKNKNYIWIGTNKSFMLYNIKDKSFEDYSNSHSDFMTVSFLEESDSSLWICTEGQGLMKYNINSKTFKSYSQNDGMPDNNVYGIYKGNDNNLWISTANGISKFDPNSMIFNNYNTSDGLSSNEFKWGAHSQCRNGDILFGGIAGFTKFSPTYIKDDLYPPEIVITDFRIFNKLIKPGIMANNRMIIKNIIPYTDTILLKHNENDISFKFSALHFSNPKDNRYKYMLEGYDEQWITTSADNRIAHYTNLFPGNYIFKVKGANPDNLWNKTSAKLQITISPPYWKTWYAYSLYMLGLITLLLLIIHLVKLKTKLKERQTLDKMKVKFFMNISHEFRTPLTLIIGPLEKLMSYKNKPINNLNGQLALMHRNAKRLMDLINQLLDLRKIETGNMKMSLTENNIVKFISEIYLAFEQLAVQKNIDYQFLPSVKTINMIFDREKMENVIYNLISNAFKYTSAKGKITVLVTTNLNNVIISINDTGIGIPKDLQTDIFKRFFQVKDENSPYQKGTGIGLSLSKELIELHSGSIKLQSELNIGSTFTIILPVKTNSENHSKNTTSNNNLLITNVNDIIDEINTLNPEQAPSILEGLPKMLIVDDNKDIRQFIKDNMQFKFNVLEAKNGEEGVKLALINIPDIIISDVMMPKMDGFEFCNQIKTNEKTSHIPIILLTAYTSDERKIQGLETGADDYITKPFNIDILTLRVQNLIESRKKLRDRFSKEIAIRTSEITVNSIDEKFLNATIKIVEDNILDPKLDYKLIINELNISRTHLYNKLKALTGESINEFIRTIRLKRAAQLIRKKAGNVTEICYQVGFGNPSYFTQRFKEKFGVTPTEYK